MKAMEDIGVLTGRRRGDADAFWRELRESFRNPEFWAFSSWLDIIARARKSRFGVLWLMAPSVVYVYGLGAFFASMQGRSFAHFAAHVALGAMVFKTMLSSLVASAGVFGANQSFIMDGHVRLTDYLLQSMARAFFDMCMYLPVVLVALVLYGDVSLQGLAMAPFTLAVIYLNGLWMATVFSLLGARFPDVGQLIGNVAIFLFLLTPIIWYPEQMPGDTLRGQLMRFNPFFHLVSLFRAPILGEPLELLSIQYLAAMTAAGLVVATLLYRRYARYVPLWI